MKKNLVYILCFLLVLAACKKSEVEPYMGNPDERLSQALTEYSQQLTGSEFGWKGYLITEENGVFSFLFNFNSGNRVNMIADIDAGTASAMESSYRLKALQRPSLLFDTYSYLHLLADPNPNVLGGAIGDGYSADFEFAFTKASADTIELEGAFYKSKLLLIRSKSREESDNFLANINSVVGNFAKLRTYFKRSSIDGVDYEWLIDPLAKKVKLSYVVNGALESHSTSFYVDGNNVILVEPFVNGSTRIDKLTGVNFAEGSVNATLNGKALTIAEATAPLFYDETAAERFNAFESQYTSFEGFTVDGVADAFGIRSIPGLTRLVFWTHYTPSYDLVGFTFGNSIRYGPAVVPQVNPDGKLSYSYLGMAGAVPAAYQNIVVNTAAAFISPGGFYVIQTGNRSYDLVRASDARVWISFVN